MGSMGKQGRKAALMALCVCACVTSAKAAQFEDELSGLIQIHPSIKSGQALVSASDKGVKAALAPYLPSLDMIGDYGQGRVSLPAFRASPDGPFEATEE